MKETTKGLGSVFFVFAGYVMSVTAFVLGGNVGNQLGFTGGILALLLGNMILALYAGVLGIIGRKAQRASTDLFKPVYGVKGQVITSSIVSLFSLVFVSVYCSLVGNMVTSLFPAVSPYVGLAVYLVILTLINLKGFKGMSVFSKFGVPMIAAFIVYGLFMVNSKVGFANVLTAQPSAPVSHFLVVEREYVKTFENVPAVRPAGFIAWVVGVCGSVFIPVGISPLNGFVVAVIVYAFLRKAVKM